MNPKHLNTQTNQIDFVHPLYAKHVHQFTLTSDVYYGIDKAKRYIRQRPLESDMDYTIRVQDAVLNNFIERITTTQAGQITRKPISFELSKEKIEHLKELNITQFVKECIEYSIVYGKHYIMIDTPVTGGLPYFVHVRRDQLINWEKDVMGYKWCVIKETRETRDKFKIAHTPQYRHLLENGNVTLWDDDNNITGQLITSFNKPLIYEIDLGDVPGLYDIGVQNIAHLNMSSILDQSTAIAMQPSLFTKGLGLGDDDLKFSTNSTINTDNEDASVEWLELSGQSIPYGVQNIKDKETNMAERALQLQGQSIKTATQVDVENSESNSRLSDIAEIVEGAMNKAYASYSKLRYLKEQKNAICLSRDFKPQTNLGVIQELNRAVIAGTLSLETFLRALDESELVSIPSVDEELTKIHKETYDGTGTGTGTGTNDA